MLYSALVQLHQETMAILEPCPAVQYRNGRIVIEDAHILGISQLFNTSLLLGQQLFAQHLWLRWRQAVIKRAGAAQMSDMCRSEEHTSELQSLMRNSYAVFCLKKKNNNK